MAEDGTAGPPGALTDAELHERLTRIDALLERLEAQPGPAAETAVEVIGALTEVYGTALSRIVALASGHPGLAASFTGDELLGHLLILHGLHPEPAAERVARALEEVRPYIRSHGGEVELAGIDDGVARIRLSGACEGCAASAATLQQAVTGTVLAAAPELAGVERAGGQDAGNGHRVPSAPLIPAESLLRKPATVAGPGRPPR